MSRIYEPPKPTGFSRGLLTTRGNPYKARGDDAKERDIHKRRGCYITAGLPTPEQKVVIDKMERIVSGGKVNGDPYRIMRNAEIIGIDFFEEELRADGKWYRMPDDDADMTSMQTGAL